MNSTTSKIDPYLFEQQFEAFKIYIEDKSGISFISFASNTYTEEQEGYKYEIYRSAREALCIDSWRSEDVGTGKIAKAVNAAIEIQDNNLVPWQAKYGPEKQPHHTLHLALDDPESLVVVETLLFDLYRGSDDEGVFGRLIEVFGRKYPLLAYLYFMKDRSQYAPIAPTFFDRAFSILGADLVTSYRCSWENYADYLSLLLEIRGMLGEALGVEVTLVDAHSFTFILAAEMDAQDKLADVQVYLDLTETERHAVVSARIGQGQFRQKLIEYWSVCAVTGCSELTLLRASHIKPWKDSSNSERLNLYNGLLLSAGIDACFDAGYITFDSDGRVQISSKLSKKDVIALGLDGNMMLSKVESSHQDFLKYHRSLYAENFSS